jgi:hypothetical protein
MSTPAVGLYPIRTEDVGAGVIRHLSQLAKIRMELQVYSPIRYLHGGVLN